MKELLQEAETIKTGYLLEDFRLFHLKDKKSIIHITIMIFTN